MKEYDIEKIRAQVRKKMGGGGKDPNEFRPPKAEDGKEIHYRFFILPGFSTGDTLASGEATRSMDLFFVDTGSHYIENKIWGCPRSIDGDSCELCDYAFSLMGDVTKASGLSDEEKKKQKSDIAKNLLSAAYKKVNIYFPDGPLGKVNPEDLRGKVKWFNASTTTFNTWWECLSRDDDGGDELKPLPHGIFYNEEAAYLYDLRLTKKGTMNSYEGSGFMVSEKLKTVPIVFGDKFKADREKIAEVLAQRHDLFASLPTIDTRALARITSNLKNGGPSSNGGFDHDEEKAPAAEAKAKPATKPASKPASRAVASEVPVETKTKPTPVEEPEAAGEDYDAEIEGLLSQIEG